MSYIASHLPEKFLCKNKKNLIINQKIIYLIPFN